MAKLISNPFLILPSIVIPDDIDEEDDSSDSSESSSSDDGLAIPTDDETIRSIKARIEYGKRWVAHQDDVERKIIDNQEWGRLGEVQTLFEPQREDGIGGEMLWAWKGNHCIYSMINNFTYYGTVPEQYQIEQLRLSMDQTRMLVMQWIGKEYDKLRPLIERRGL